MHFYTCTVRTTVSLSSNLTYKSKYSSVRITEDNVMMISTQLLYTHSTTMYVAFPIRQTVQYPVILDGFYEALDRIVTISTLIGCSGKL